MLNTFTELFVLVPGPVIGQLVLFSVPFEVLSLLILVAITDWSLLFLILITMKMIELPIFCSIF